MFDGSGSLADWVAAVAAVLGVAGAAWAWVTGRLRRPLPVVADIRWGDEPDNPTLYGLQVAPPTWGAMIVEQIEVSADLEISPVFYKVDETGGREPTGDVSWGRQLVIKRAVNAFARADEFVHLIRLRRIASTSRKPSRAVIHLTATSPIRRQFRIAVTIITPSVSA